MMVSHADDSSYSYCISSKCTGMTRPRGGDFNAWWRGWMLIFLHVTRVRHLADSSTQDDLLFDQFPFCMGSWERRVHSSGGDYRVTSFKNFSSTYAFLFFTAMFYTALHEFNNKLIKVNQRLVFLRWALCVLQRGIRCARALDKRRQVFQAFGLRILDTNKIYSTLRHTARPNWTELSYRRVPEKC